MRNERKIVGMGFTSRELMDDPHNVLFSLCLSPSLSFSPPLPLGSLWCVTCIFNDYAHMGLRTVHSSNFNCKVEYKFTESFHREVKLVFTIRL